MKLEEVSSKADRQYASFTNSELVLAVELMISPNDLMIREIAETLLASLDFTEEEVRMYIQKKTYLRKNHKPQESSYGNRDCGDWSQVCGGSWQTDVGTCGVFFDPPYSAEDRGAVYANESFTVAHDVRQWCLKRGGNPLMRIALCGYDTEHTELEAHGWKVYKWQTQGGYANRGENTRGRKNAKRERIWFSPHCLHEPTLFDLFD